jgi:hypothetical protein
MTRGQAILKLLKTDRLVRLFAFGSVVSGLALLEIALKSH